MGSGVERAVPGSSASDPSWDEAVAAFGSGEPVELIRPARTLVIDVAHIGNCWIATSSQLAGFRQIGKDRAAVEMAAGEDLAGWLDSAVTVEFREAVTPGIDEVA